MSGYEQEIDELLADYRKKREEANQMRRRINETTATATAPRRVVKVTVSARGEVTEIDFPTGAFRRLTPKELGSILTATIADARAQALAALDEMAFGVLPMGASASALLMGTAEFGGDLLPPEPEPVDAVADYLKQGGRPGGGDHPPA